MPLLEAIRSALTAFVAGGASEVERRCSPAGQSVVMVRSAMRAAFGHDTNAMSERLSDGGRWRTLVDARFSDT